MAAARVAHSIQVRVVGSRSNRDGLGARVTLTAGGRTQVREVKSGSSYLGQNDVRAHAGLGASDARGSNRCAMADGQH